MNGIISNSQMILVHAQRNPQHILDEQHDQTRHNNVQSNDEQRSHNLDPHLLSVAINGATRVRDTESLTTLHRREDACEEAAKQTTHSVGVEVAKNIVDGEERLGTSEDVHAEPRDGAGAYTDDEGAPAGDDTGGGGDGDEAGDFTFDGAEDGGLFDWTGRLVRGDRLERRERTVCNIKQCPDDGGDGGAEIGVEDGDTCVGGCSVWVPPLKPEKESVSHLLFNSKKQAIYHSIQPIEYQLQRAQQASCLGRKCLYHAAYEDQANKQPRILDSKSAQLAVIVISQHIPAVPDDT